MKTLKIILIISFIVALLVGGSLVSALDTGAITASPVLSKNSVNIGSSIMVRITVDSNTAEPLQLLHVGVNFDWMDSGLFFGPNLSGNPVTLAANGSYTTPPFPVQVPTNVSVGSHTYFVGVDGTESTNQNEFYWNSTTAFIQVLPANTTGNTPTITTSPTGGGGGQTTTGSTSPLNLIIYLAVAAIVVVVVLALIVMVVQKKRKRKVSATAPAATADEQPKKPNEEQNKKEEKDSFDAQI